MGIVFTLENPDSPVLMDCSRTWGERFVRLSQWVAQEYDHPSIFLWDGEIVCDFVYLDLPQAEALFEATSRHPDWLIFGWAEGMAGMLEIATQRSWRQPWQARFPHFRPRYNGVDRKDIPHFEPDVL